MVHSPKQLEDHDRLTGAPDAGRIELPRVSSGGGSPTAAPAPQHPAGQWARPLTIPPTDTHGGDTSPRRLLPRGRMAASAVWSDQ